MKTTLLLLVTALTASFILLNSSPQVVNRSFAENFAFDEKDQQVDRTGIYNFSRGNSFIGFRIRHNGLIEVPGFFRDFAGKINYDAKDIEKSSVEFTAKMTSVDTGVAGRDNHLRNADFFDVEKYPEMTFKSTKVEKNGNNLIITGDFTMKGVTKQISFPFQIVGFTAVNQNSGGTMGLAAETTINRRDFGVNWDHKSPDGVLNVSEDVKINLQIEADRPKAQ